MEELGGNNRWLDRFLAKHIGILYYWISFMLYLMKPNLAYNLSENIEKHAFESYDQFIKEHKKTLKNLPAPKIAKEYYQNNQSHVFYDFQTDREIGSRRPIIRNLYDVFFNIRNDEAEHFKTMVKAQDHQS